MNSPGPGRCLRCGSKLLLPGQTALKVTLTAASAPSWFPLAGDTSLDVTVRVCLDCGAVEWDADPAVLHALRNQALSFNMPE